MNWVCEGGLAEHFKFGLNVVVFLVLSCLRGRDSILQSR